jgi:hypothetical protein
MDIEEHGAELRRGLVDFAVQRQCAADHWSGNAETLHRLGLIDEEELQEMLTYSDAAFAHL